MVEKEELEVDPTPVEEPLAGLQEFQSMVVQELSVLMERMEPGLLESERVAEEAPVV
jgi:hypothetical protein